MDDRSLRDLKEVARKAILNTGGSMEEVHEYAKDRLSALGSKKGRELLYILLTILIPVLYFVFIVALSAYNVISLNLNVITVQNFIIFWFVVPFILVIAVLYIFFPMILKLRNVKFDINRFVYGVERLKNAEKDDDGDYNLQEKAVKKGVLRTFNRETVLNVDEAMSAMRRVTGYNVVRDEDIIDVGVFIEDIIIPRIKSSRKVEVPNKLPNICGNIERFKENSFDYDELEPYSVDQYWASCRDDMHKICEDTKVDETVKTTLKCDNSGYMEYSGFMFKPRGSDVEIRENCKNAIDDEGVKAVIHDKGKCYVIKTNTPEWEIDVDADATLWNKSIVNFPTYNVGDVVDDIISEIQLVSPIPDLSPHEQTIRDGLKDSSLTAEDEKNFDEIVTALLIESKRRSESSEDMEKGANLKTDLATFKEYIEGTTVKKFNDEIAWPVMKAFASVAARNEIFGSIGKRRVTIFNFYNIMFIIIFVFAQGGLISYGLSKILGNFEWKYVTDNLFPLVPVFMMYVVFVVSISNILARRKHIFAGNMTIQSSNASIFTERLYELATFLHGSPPATIKSKSLEPGDVIDINDDVVTAVIEDNSSKISFYYGDGNTMLKDTFKEKSPSREKLLRKMALVLEAYDKCHNIYYTGGSPFPTAIVIAYVGIIVIAVALMFVTPGFSGWGALKNIERARDLRKRGNEDALTALWESTGKANTDMKEYLKWAAVIGSVIFSIIFTVKISEDTERYKNYAQSGRNTIFGNCV